MKSDIVPTKPIERVDTRVNDILELEKKEIEELEPIKISKLERLSYNLREIARDYKYRFLIGKNLLKLYLEIKMSSPITTKLSERAFWIKAFGILFMVLAWFGIKTEVLESMLEQIVTFIIAVVALLSGFWYDKKTGEATKDDVE